MILINKQFDVVYKYYLAILKLSIFERLVIVLPDVSVYRTFPDSQDVIQVYRRRIRKMMKL